MKEFIRFIVDGILITALTGALIFFASSTSTSVTPYAIAICAIFDTLVIGDFIYSLIKKFNRQY
jgi:hypothetical protein